MDFTQDYDFNCGYGSDNECGCCIEPKICCSCGYNGVYIDPYSYEEKYDKNFLSQEDECLFKCLKCESLLLCKTMCVGEPVTYDGYDAIMYPNYELRR